MSVGPMAGIAGSAAGAPLSQTKGSEAERSAQEASARERETHTEQRAAEVAGVGQTDQDEGAGDRDADGRRLWEQTEQDAEEHASHETEQDSPAEERQSKDPSGVSGSFLDLTG